MSATSTGCFIIAVVLLLSFFRRGSDLLSPARIFALIWVISIALADLKLSYYQHQWSLHAWLLLWLGPSAFLLGAMIARIQNLNLPLLSVQSVRRRLSGVLFNRVVLFRSIVFLFLAYMACYLAETLIEGGLPFFSARPDRARIDFGVFGLHLMVGAMPVILFLALEYLLLTPAHTREKIILGIIFAITGISFFLILQRYSFMVWALMSLPLLYYTRQQLRFRHLAILAGMFFAFLVLIQSLRLVAYAQNYIFLVSRMKYSVTYAPLTEPYMYIVMNLENYARAVDNLHRFTYGYFTTDFIMALTGLKHWAASYFNIPDRPFLVSGYNTYPFMWTYYYDFGVIGVMFFPLVIGWGISHIYLRLRTRPTLFVTVLYCFAFYFVTISFFTNPLTMLNTAFHAFILLGVHRFFINEKGYRLQEIS